MIRKFLSPLVAILASCSVANPAQLQQQIAQTEAAFAQMAAQQGLRAAFVHYAHPQATIQRQGKLWHGQVVINQYFDMQEKLKNEQLTWTPTYIDVAQSGDMAYTYGNFQYQATTLSGDTIRSQGFFHTVWRRLPNGQWRFVWD